MTVPPSSTQIAAATLALDLNRAALNGDMVTLEQLLPDATPKDRVQAAGMACERRQTAACMDLLNTDLHEVDARDLNVTLSLAARAGMVDAIRSLLNQRADLDKEAALVSALLCQQSDVVSLLGPQVKLQVVVDDLRDNFDDSYNLSYEQMAATVDQLAAFFCQAEREDVCQSLGPNLLPLTSACSQAHRRALAGGKLPAMAPARNRPRH